MGEEKREEILRVLVKLEETMVVEGCAQDAIMIAFSGEAGGPYFHGRVLPHGVDTQKRPKGEKARLSARYMLEGEDDRGEKCRMFIENNGMEDADGVLRTRPMILTDSASLAWMEQAALTGTVEGADDGVVIRIYAEDR